MNPSRILVPLLILVALAIGSYWLFLNQSDPEIAPEPNPPESTQPETPANDDPLSPGPATGTLTTDTGSEQSQRVVAVADNTNAHAAQGVKGRVMLPGGVPAAEVPVFVIESMMNDPIRAFLMAKTGKAPAPISSGRTAADGTFALGVLVTSKSYDLRIASDSHPELTHQSIKVREGDWYDTGDLTLDQGMVVTGRVIDEITKAGIGDATVYLASSSQSHSILPTPGRERGIVAVTNGTGHFRFTSAPSEGMFNITAEADGYASGKLTNQIATAGKPLVLEIAQGQPIAGVVVNHLGEPLRGVQITAQGMSQKTPQTARTQTNRQGVFTFPSLRVGPYQLVTNSRAYAEAKTPPVMTGDLEVKLVVVQRPWVKLQVTGSNGRTLKNYKISLKRHFPNNPIGIGNVPEFNDRRITPGDYPSSLGGNWAKVSGLPAGNFVFQITERNHAKSLSLPFVVTDGGAEASAEVIAQLTLGAAIIGTVIDDLGKPVRGATVATDMNNAFDGGGGIFDLFRSMIPERHTKTQVKTDRQGRFRISSLAFAEYMVRVSHANFCQATTLDITLSEEGQVVDVGTVQLVRGTLIEGFTTVDGRAAGQIKVTLSMPQPGQPGGPAIVPGKPVTAAQMFTTRAISDNDGRFRLLKRVPPGTYKVVAARATGESNPFMILLDMKESERTITLHVGQDRLKIDFELSSR